MVSPINFLYKLINKHKQIIYYEKVKNEKKNNEIIKSICNNVTCTLFWKVNVCFYVRCAAAATATATVEVKMLKIIVEEFCLFHCSFTKLIFVFFCLFRLNL